MRRVYLGLLELLLLGIWLGGMVFFTFIIAPTAFRALDREHAGLFLRAAFPNYYLFGIVLGAATLFAGILERFASADWGKVSRISLILVAAMVLGAIYGRAGLLPHVESRREARSAVAAGTPEYEAADFAFQVAHRFSVLLNGAIMVTGFFVFATVSLRERHGLRAGTINEEKG